MIREKVFGYSGWTKTRECRPLPLIASQSFERQAAEPQTSRDMSRQRAREGFQRETEMAIATINPATGQVVKTFEPLSDAQIEVKLQKAADTFLSYRKVPFAERALKMFKAAAILDGEKETFAKMMTTEIGKTFRSAVDEAAKCAWVWRYYAENEERC